MRHAPHLERPLVCLAGLVDQEEVQESSDHDDQEEAKAITAHDELIAVGSVMNDMLDAETPQPMQALTAHDDLVAAGSVMNDMLDAETSQPMQQERLKADEELKHKLQGLFDFSKSCSSPSPSTRRARSFSLTYRPPISAIACSTTLCHLSRCTQCSPTRTMTTSCRSKRS